jgi:hypothetical protein
MSVNTEERTGKYGSAMDQLMGGKNGLMPLIKVPNRLSFWSNFNEHHLSLPHTLIAWDMIKTKRWPVRL